MKISKSILKCAAVMMALIMAFTFMPFINDDATVYAASMNEKTLAANIAKEYQQNDEFVKDPNSLWATADMAAYAKSVKGTKYKFSAIQKQTILNAAVEFVASTDKPSDLSKSILAIAALGFDASKITTKDGKKIDAVKVLTDQIDAEQMDYAVTSQYTIGYEIIALQQFGKKYQSQIDKLVKLIIDQKAVMLDTQWGIDAIPPIMLALAPYSKTNNDVKEFLEEAKTIIKNVATLDDNGAITSWGSTSAETTGLLIAGLVATGENPKTFFEGKDLVNGLVSLRSADDKGFNSYYTGTPTKDQLSTEQGFRGLVASINKAGFRLYDFSGKLKAAVATKNYNTVVKSIVKNIQAKAKVTKVKGKVKVSTVLTANAKAQIKEIKKLGYKVKYKTIKPTKKNGKYKAKVLVYTKAGKLLATSR